MEVVFTILFFYSFIAASVRSLFELSAVGRVGHCNESNPGLMYLFPIDEIEKGFFQAILTDNKIFVSGIKKETTYILLVCNLTRELLRKILNGRPWSLSYVSNRIYQLM